MSRYHSYIRSATTIIEKYQGKEPFSSFIKKQFAAEKKFGSGDRRFISELCYGFFRTSHLFKGSSIEDGLIFSYFLLNKEASDFLNVTRPELLPSVSFSLNEKLKLLGKDKNIFPFPDQVSSYVDINDFSDSLLKQPSAFLRLRPGRKLPVINALKEKDLNFKLVEEDAIELPPSSKLDDTFHLNRDAVVQDLSSQHVLDNLIDEVGKNNKIPDMLNVWDCCAASGGKSILLFDKLNGKVKLTVSDIRDQIIVNLKTRLKQARVPVYNAFVTDLTTFETNEKFDIIICDAPCSGSGTWARTPEQLYIFPEKKISEYSALQKKLVEKTVSSLNQNALYCYITCSVFKEENEEVVEHIKSLGFSLLNATYHKGYDKNADTLFSAVFSRSLL